MPEITNSSTNVTVVVYRKKDSIENRNDIVEIIRRNAEINALARNELQEVESEIMKVINYVNNLKTGEFVAFTTLDYHGDASINIDEKIKFED